MYLLPFAAIAVAALIARRAERRISVESASSMLASSWMPALLGIVTAVVIWWVWGSLAQVPVYHDEAAYTLQARIFASGRWVAPGRPLPRFFEQMAVLVTPVLAPKMPPGHAMVMVPGIWLGLPGLAPVALGGVAGALLFALARRISNPWIAVLAWFIWITAPGVLIWHAAYFSETTTGALWLAGWWALLEWRDTRRWRWLLALAACVGWGAITRPLTMLAYAIPLAPWVVVTVIRRRAWKDFTLALTFGVAILGIIPLWSSRTTGDWRTTPLSLYTRMYMPWDIPGFGVDTTPPLRVLPQDLQQIPSRFTRLHARYSVQFLPHAFRRRLVFISRDMWSGWRRPLEVLAVLGLLVLSPEGAFAVVTAAALVLAYLSYAHAPGWSLYYVEIQPVLAFLTAIGCWLTMSWIAKLLARGDDRVTRPSGARTLPLAAIVVLLMALTPALSTIGDAHSRRARETAYHRLFRALAEQITTPKSIVFVRYRPQHVGDFSLVRNVPDLRRAPMWVVYDRGAEDTSLMHLAPDRTPYLFDEAHFAIIPLPRESAQR